MEYSEETLIEAMTVFLKSEELMPWHKQVLVSLDPDQVLELASRLKPNLSEEEITAIANKHGNLLMEEAISDQDS